MELNAYRLCIQCNGIPLYHCSNCRQVGYCSLECRDKDAKVHQFLCEDWNKVQVRDRPNLVRALLFPQDHTRPCFIWVPCLKELQRHIEIPNTSWTDCAICELLRVRGEEPNVNHVVQRSIEIADHTTRKHPRPLRHRLSMRVREDLVQGGPVENHRLKLNRSLCAFTDGRMTMNWRGPAVFLAESLYQPEPRTDDLGRCVADTYMDITMHDLRDIHDWLLWYPPEDFCLLRRSSLRDSQLGPISSCDLPVNPGMAPHVPKPTNALPYYLPPPSNMILPVATEQSRSQDKIDNNKTVLTGADMPSSVYGLLF